ncbi:MAG: ribonuclease P protein component [Betaproteobacteria bacterium]|nr:ribonuclease P protein component [Betaproteobacteria bacterium]MCL2886872.1 ribonuclease P protein component [Betaproteobacteria bacterium]
MTRTFDEVDHSFARRYRLTKTDEFSSVFGFRKALRGQLLMLHYQPRAAGEIAARLGLVVGKKFLPRAVDRNRCKRVLREQFRLRRGELPACDVVARLASKPGKLDAALLVEDFLALLAKLRRRAGPHEIA